jgi:hypothetical protein
VLMSLDVVGGRRGSAVATRRCGGAVSVISTIVASVATVARSRPFLVASLVVLTQLQD